MKEPSRPEWLNWSSRLQTIAQNGLTFAHDPYDIERYKAIREIAAEMISAGADLDLAIVRDVLSQDSGYATPKVDVRGVVFQNNKLLLVQERTDGCWTVPGGWADPSESLAENVTREVFEESGFQTRPTKILAMFDRSLHPHQPPFVFHVYKVFVSCDIVGGAAASSSETAAVGFFGESELPDLSTSRVTAWQIQRLFEHHRHPGLPTEFDPLKET
jgi:ADP-ribose pyrophosphatase YjhB (NUDIX family)